MLTHTHTHTHTHMLTYTYTHTNTLLTTATKAPPTIKKGAMDSRSRVSLQSFKNPTINAVKKVVTN